MSLIVKIKNKTRNWDKLDRPRVGEVVDRNGNYFQNISGINSEPQTGLNKDWVFVGSITPIKRNNLNIASKGPGNMSENIEIGDIVYGLLDDGVTFIPFGRYLGDVNGDDLQNVDNYKVNPLEF